MIAKPLSISTERSWRMGEMHEDWRKASVNPVFWKTGVTLAFFKTSSISHVLHDLSKMIDPSALVYAFH